MDCPGIEDHVASQRKENKSLCKTEQTSTSESPNELAQPWKKIIDEISASNQANPLDKDFFVCKDGFYSHSLAA